MCDMEQRPSRCDVDDAAAAVEDDEGVVVEDTYPPDDAAAAADIADDSKESMAAEDDVLDEDDEDFNKEEVEEEEEDEEDDEDATAEEEEDVEEDVEEESERAVREENGAVDDPPRDQDADDDDDDKVDDEDDYFETDEPFVTAQKRDSKQRRLNKMHAMEDAREGSDVPSAQPSSPGHAEQRVNDDAPDQDHDENNDDSADPSAGETNDAASRQSPVLYVDTNGLKNEPKDPETLEDGGTSSDTLLLDADDVDRSANDVASTIDAPVYRKRSNDSSNEASHSQAKRLKTSDLEANYLIRDKILTDYIESTGCANSLINTQRQIDQLVAEIRTLNELVKEKEKEWNNIIHVKKVKEELLLRIQRRRQVLLLNGDQETLPEHNLTTSSKQSYGANSSRTHQQHSLKSTQVEVNGCYDPKQFSAQSKQRMVLDVQSIIADYRQRHPEAVPRRGRRIRSIFNQGSGASGKHVTTSESNSELGQLLSSSNENARHSVLKSNNIDGSDHLENLKDVFVHFTKMSSGERADLLTSSSKPATTYSEVTVHPLPAQQQHTNVNSNVNNSSLLHGILTKNHTVRTSSASSAANTDVAGKASFSPTLARLLTAPERAAAATASTTLSHPAAASSSVSISEMLSNNKARNEITITPVGGPKFDKATQQQDEEADDSADRLVIDESDAIGEHRSGRADNGSDDAADDVPQCQGCNLKAAQFVCAGCGNQWYCSRECQVVAWDEHSEVCSG